MRAMVSASKSGYRVRTSLERGAAVDDLDVLEAGAGEFAYDVVLGECAGHACGPGGGAGEDLRGQVLLVDGGSETHRRPPGRRTRAHSAITRALWGERLS